MKAQSRQGAADYDNAYTNFGAHIAEHRWACVGKLDDVQQHILNSHKAETTDENGWCVRPAPRTG